MLSQLTVMQTYYLWNLCKDCCSGADNLDKQRKGVIAWLKQQPQPMFP